MKQAQLFDATMDVLWGDDPSKSDPVARALASYVKNHRLNAENGFDVLGLLWPAAEMTARASFTQVTDDESETQFDVKFRDGSTVVMIGHRGICNMIEVVALDDPAAVTPAPALSDEENQFLVDLTFCSADLVGWATQQFGNGKSLADVKATLRRAMESVGRA